jgi:Domain of unknown function (DUF4282)
VLKFLYALHLLVGLVAAVTWVVLAFQQAPVQGLLALLALAGYFIWILYCRVILEVLAAVFRIVMPSRQIAPRRSNRSPAARLAREFSTSLHGRISAAKLNGIA